MAAKDGRYPPSSSPKQNRLSSLCPLGSISCCHFVELFVYGTAQSGQDRSVGGVACGMIVVGGVGLVRLLRRRIVEKGRTRLEPMRKIWGIVEGFVESMYIGAVFPLSLS